MNTFWKMCAALCLVTSSQVTARAQQTQQDATARQQQLTGQKTTVTPCNPTTDPHCPDMNPFRGLKFGLGVAYSSSLGGVGSVSVDPTTRVVHVTKQNASAARGVFEAHYFWEFCNATNRGGAFIYIPSHYDTSTRKYECWTDNATYKDVSFGMGPFVSLNTSPFDTSGSSSGAKLFDSVGVGWMIGLNAFPTGPSGLHSLNFGVGAIIDTGVKVLSPGVMDGLPTTLPAGTETRLVTKTGFMALLTYKIVDISSPSAAP